jgi:predicted P-loop ATPase
MNIARSNETATKLPKFDILKHLDKLTPDGGSTSGKDEISYHCPICGSNNFKIHIDGKDKGKWSTWSCQCAKSAAGKQKIKDKLAPLNWRKPNREKGTARYTYQALYEGEPIDIAQVRRADNGEGKRSFNQWHRDGNKWVPGLPDEVKARVHLYQIFNELNQSAIANGQTILIVEGEGKVDLLLSLGIAATCSIGGGGKWTQYGYPNYLQDLEGAAVVICPDRDQPGIKHADEIALDFPDAKWLYAAPTSYLWERLIQLNKGFDIKDWINDDGATKDDILNAIGDRRELITSLPPPPEPPELPPPKEPTVTKSYRGGETRLQIDYEMIESEVGHQLRFDEATQNFYLGRDKFALEFAKMTLSIDFGLPIKSGKEDVMDICVRLAQRNAFNSITDYLDHCKKTAKPNDLWDLAARFFGTGSALHQIYLKKWLIAAVARAYEPGCKADDTLILQGHQGQRKSSFFQALVPNKEWFNANGLKGGKISDDEVRTAHRVWLIECPEIDKTFKKACSSELKAFMTLQFEWLRPLYAKLPVQLNRRSLMAGTTNELEFFTDETGNRRYWVIPVIPKQIDVSWLIENRDSIWAGAVAAYEAGEQWYLTREEETLQHEENRNYQREHPWQAAIEFYVDSLNEITIGEIMFDALKLSLDKVGRSEQMQVSGIIKMMGFKKTKRKKTFMAQRQVLWEKVAGNS